MKAWITFDETGRICSVTTDEAFACDEDTEFDLPDDFDIYDHMNWIVKDGVLERSEKPDDPAVRIAELKRKLQKTDYIAAKAADAIMLSKLKGADTLGDICAEYAEQLEQRQAWRDEINELEDGSA